MAQSRPVRTAASIFLLLCFAALGSGLLKHAHEAAHALAAPAAACHHGDHDAPAEPGPDATAGCFLHAQLNLPILSAGYVPILVALGLIVAFLTQLAPVWVSAFTCRAVVCRGPPALSSM